MNTSEKYRSALRILSALLLLVFMAALWVIIRPFVTPLLWAIVLTTTTWPLFAALKRRIPSPSYLAPLLCTLGLGIILILVMVPLPLQLAAEMIDLRGRLSNLNISKIQDSITASPIVGPILSKLYRETLTEPLNLATLLGEHQKELIALAGGIVRGALSTIVLTAASLIGCYVLYSSGEGVLQQLRRVMERIGGESIPKLLDTVNLTVRGAAYSVLATAAAQGVLAGIGYYISGAPVPVLLSLITMVVSLIPFGPPFIYLPVAIYLLSLSGLPWYHGVGLAVWGIVVVSTVDNLLRPLFISQTTKVPPILVFIGVLGGVTAFGLLGVFIGPALIAVAHWLWLDFGKE
jgi:predicted PurR-regulated permease PerM